MGNVLFEDSLLTLGAAMLSEVYSDERDQFQQHVHLPCAARAVEGGSRDPVRELRVQRLCK